MFLNMRKQAECHFSRLKRITIRTHAGNVLPQHLMTCQPCRGLQESPGLPVVRGSPRSTWAFVIRSVIRSACPEKQDATLQTSVRRCKERTPCSCRPYGRPSRGASWAAASYRAKSANREMWSDGQAEQGMPVFRDCSEGGRSTLRGRSA